MAKTLEAHDKLIREIFEGSYQFEIPDYQRPYAWTTEQAGDITDFLYKKGKVSLGEKNEYRLTAREEDADFFRANIQELGGIARLVASTDKEARARRRPSC